MPGIIWTVRNSFETHICVSIFLAAGNVSGPAGIYDLQKQFILTLTA